jgi:solute:Na+ symporter, SSS family
LSPSLVALTIISIIVVVGSIVGFLARYHHQMDLEQWTVGGRGFGLILVWLLMAGEIMTTFTFLGASGWAYSRGAPAFYILGYQPLMYVVSFYILPPIWELGRKFRLQTQADFFQMRYGSTYLAAFVAVVGVVCLVPYLQIQITGLGLIVEVASFGAVPRTAAMVIAFALVAAFVFVSGVRGVAWASILKDVLLLIAAVYVGVAVPRIYFGGVRPMFAALARTNPAHLVLPGATTNLGHAWFISSILLSSLGCYMWPQFFASTFTAKSGRVLRRNAVLMPFYGVTLPLMFIVGFTAFLVLPGLTNGDLSLLTIVRKTFPAWFLGFVGGAGALTAMVCAAIQLLTGATLYAKNLFRPIFAPDMTDDRLARLAKIMVLVLTSAALLFAVFSSASLVGTLLMAYAGVAQLFPGVVLGLFWRRVTTAGVAAGLASGLSVAAFMMLTSRDPFHGVNAGFIALCINFAVTFLVSSLTPVSPSPFDSPEPRSL